MDSKKLSVLGEAALWYVQNGFAIFPLGVESKKPAVKNGLNDWTDNPDDVRSYWKAKPYANIGITCGAPSNGLLVIDLDIEEDGTDGRKTLAEWASVYGELPETAEATTGSGGKHLFYRTDRTTIRPSTNKSLGVDIRCDGSYIVAPPSVHPDTGDTYEWDIHPDEVPIADATGVVYDFIDYVKRNGSEEDGTKKANGKFKLPDKIKKGGRDSTLFKYAAHLRAIGRSDEEIHNAVLGANLMRCDPPLDSKDIERIVKSACKYERGEDDDDDKKVGAFGAGKPKDTQNFRGKRGGLLTNKLGAYIIETNHARIIDGAPALWTGTHWAFGTNAISKAALFYADDAKKQDKNEVISYIQDKADTVISDYAFDGRPYVQFQNGTYDVLANEMVEPTPEMYIIAKLPINLNLEAPPNLADEFISSVSDNDAVVEKVLKEVIGACMCSMRLISTSPLLIGRAQGGRGQASNGKSTYINLLRGILGAQNISSLDIATLGQKFQTGRVAGKLANLGDDIPDGFLRSDELSTFKKLVTGDTIFTDVKGGRGYEFKPSATMVFSMNNIPRLSDTSEGVFRRLSFVPFKRKFTPDTEGYDPYIAKKLAKREVLERAALLGLMEIRSLYERGGLTVIPEMVDEVEEVRADNDSVLSWIAENNLTEESFDGFPVQIMYERYRDYCKDYGEKYPVGMKTFSKRVRSEMVAISIKDIKNRNSKKVLKHFVISNIG